MLSKKSYFPTFFITSVMIAGASMGAGAEQLPATPHQAQAIDDVETKKAPRPETEQRMPTGDHQSDALKADETDADTADKDLSQRIEKLSAYTAAQRDEAIQEARAALTAIDERIDRLQTSLAQGGDQLTTAARERMSQSIDAMESQREDLSEWMGGLMHSSEQAWQHVQTGFVDAYRAFAEQLDKAEKSF